MLFIGIVLIGASVTMLACVKVAGDADKDAEQLRERWFSEQGSDYQSNESMRI